MKKQAIILLLLLFSESILLSAQSIKVLDNSTLQPIPLVTVFSESEQSFANSNEDGIVNLSGFRSDDVLIFQHPAYARKSITYAEIIKAEVIYLVEEPLQMSGVVISASRWPQSSEEVPNQVLSISKKEIEFASPQTSADLLESTGQVFVQKSQMGGGSPNIRGFAANSVLISVDGVRMNNAIFRSGNLQNVINIDPNSIESTEVIYGPGSVIYGSDALGGVMNFNTVKPKMLSNKEASIKLKGSALLRYSSANNEKTGHADFNLRGRKLSWYSSFSYSDFDDLITGSNRTTEFPDFGKRPEYVDPNGPDTVTPNSDENKQVFSGYSTVNTLQKLRFRPKESIDLTYSFHFSNTSDIPRYDRLTIYDEALPESSEWYYGPQTWMMNSIDIIHYADSKLFDRSRFIAAYQSFEESRNDRTFQSTELRERTENVNAFSLNLDLDKSLQNGNQLFYGLEFVTNKVKSKAQSTDINSGAISPLSTRYPDGGSTWNSFAAYFNYKMELNEGHHLNIGSRYSHFSVKSNFEDTSFYNFPYDQIVVRTGAISGNIGWAYQTESQFEMSAVLSTGFRAPNVDDIGKVFDSEPGRVVVPNEELGPENTYNIEISIAKSLHKLLSFRLTGFYTILRDAIERRDYTFNGMDSIIYDGELSKVEAMVNIGEGRIAGVSASMTIEFNSKLFLSSDFTFLDGIDTDSQVSLQHSTPSFGKTSLVFHGSKYRINLNSRYQGAMPFDELAPSEQNKPHLYTADGALSWTTINLTASWQLSPHLELNGSIENILDTHYRTFGSGISAPGRNFILSIRGRL